MMTPTITSCSPSASHILNKLAELDRYSLAVGFRELIPVSTTHHVSSLAEALAFIAETPVGCLFVAIPGAKRDTLEAFAREARETQRRLCLYSFGFARLNGFNAVFDWDETADAVRAVARGDR